MSAPISAGFEIEFLSGPRDGEVVQVPNNETTIGRDKTLSVSVPPDKTLSRRHARIRNTDEGFSVEDLNSSFGTFVNEEKVTAPRNFATSDIIRAGRTELICRPLRGDTTATQLAEQAEDVTASE